MYKIFAIKNENKVVYFTVNFALYKPATQSVDPAGDDGGEKAVDGDENTCIEVTSTTNVETIWSVDLGEAKHVIGLVIIVPGK